MTKIKNSSQNNNNNNILNEYDDFYLFIFNVHYLISNTFKKHDSTR